MSLSGVVARDGRRRLFEHSGVRKAKPVCPVQIGHGLSFAMTLGSWVDRPVGADRSHTDQVAREIPVKDGGCGCRLPYEAQLPRRNHVVSPSTEPLGEVNGTGHRKNGDEK